MIRVERIREARYVVETEVVQSVLWKSGKPSLCWVYQVEGTRGWDPKNPCAGYSRKVWYSVLRAFIEFYVLLNRALTKCSVRPFDKSSSQLTCSHWVGNVGCDEEVAGKLSFHPLSTRMRALANGTKDRSLSSSFPSSLPLSGFRIGDALSIHIIYSEFRTYWELRFSVYVTVYTSLPFLESLGNLLRLVVGLLSSVNTTYCWALLNLCSTSGLTSFIKLLKHWLYSLY